MVKSKLSSTVNYPEHKKMNPRDEDFEASVYDTNILGVPVVIAIGQPQDTFLKSDNIIYYPIYVVDDGAVDSQIGVYEIESTRIPEIMDEDGDVDISEMGEPLLYSSFVTEKFLEQFKHTPDDEVAPDDEDTPEDEDTPDDEGANFPDTDESTNTSEHPSVKSITPKSKFSPLPEQTEKEAMEERNAFSPEEIEKEKKLPWIQHFLHNENYKIVDNEGGGDCLFAAIRDGLTRVGVKKTVAEMRKLLSDAATQSVFRGYETMYNDTNKEIASLREEIQRLAKEHAALQERFSKTKDGNMQRVIISQAEETAKRHTDAQKELKQAALNIREFKFMKGITTLEAFKAKIQTCDFWGDTWAISTLERVLKIKLILLSSESYKGGILDDVLNCGQLNDSVLEKAGIFRPTHYIMLDYVGDHYKLITYKERGAFTFKELPLDIKKLCVDKCMERMGGAYVLIPEFRAFMETQNKKLPEEDNAPSDLYDGVTVFQFYSKSGAAAPGKGSGEKLGPEGKVAYKQLAIIKDWRRMLSNFWPATFTLDGKQWTSVEHYYQASKFKKENPDFYQAFSLNGEEAAAKVIDDPLIIKDLPLNPGLAKSMGGKTGKFKGKLLRPKTITMDKDFDARKDAEMEKAMYAKFSQHPELRDMLLLTKKAKLQHFSRGSPPIVFNDLMRVRKQLATETKQ
mgnify:CR=1 FL=1|tara:strand:+ start:7131 stop:9176 length:2046 start_codon:yes stop_codon:yes gene_type:complete